MRREPRRVRRLNKIYANQGGVARFVFARHEEGIKVEDIALELSEACGEIIPDQTLRFWMRSWRSQEEETAAA